MDRLRGVSFGGALRSERETQRIGGVCMKTMSPRQKAERAGAFLFPGCPFASCRGHLFFLR